MRRWRTAITWMAGCAIACAVAALASDASERPAISPSVRASVATMRGTLDAADALLGALDDLAADDPLQRFELRRNAVLLLDVLHTAQLSATDVAETRALSEAGRGDVADCKDFLEASRVATQRIDIDAGAIGTLRRANRAARIRSQLALLRADVREARAAVERLAVDESVALVPHLPRHLPATTPR